MIVTAALCFWNERPKDLDACVRGMANIADRVVVLDGAYARFPGATIRSPEIQLEAIRKAAKAVGMECLIVQPNRLWVGQVEKRSYLMALAATGSDWVAVVDTDHMIKADRQRAREFLERTPFDVVSVPFATPKNPKRSIEASSATNWHRDQVGQVSQLPHIFRALGNIRVEKYHYWYSAMKNGQRYWMWGGDQSYGSLQVVAMEAPYQVEHRSLFRTVEQIRAGRAFINDRVAVIDETGQEDHQPGLPDPAWDYTTVPL